jgi:hypothetical protein
MGRNSVLRFSDTRRYQRAPRLQLSRSRLLSSLPRLEKLASLPIAAASFLHSSMREPADLRPTGVPMHWSPVQRQLMPSISVSVVAGTGRSSDASA